MITAVVLVCAGKILPTGVQEITGTTEVQETTEKPGIQEAAEIQGIRETAGTKEITETIATVIITVTPILINGLNKKSIHKKYPRI